MEARLERELEFHNKRFASGTRGADKPGGLADVEKFYSIVERSRSYYWESIQEGCEGKRILEYGCGTGSHAFSLAKKGARVTGIDISDVAVEKAQRQANAERIQGLDFAAMNAEELKFPDNTFDLICGTAILHHLDLTKAFPELARTLKPGGKAVFVEPLGHNPVINLYRRLTPGVRTPDEHPLLMRDFKLARGWFDKVDIRCFHLFSLCAVPFRRHRSFGRLLRWFDHIDAGLFRATPFMRRYAWATVVHLSPPAKGIPAT
jgi:SAM-dependent methyltransferase